MAKPALLIVVLAALLFVLLHRFTSSDPLRTARNHLDSGRLRESAAATLSALKDGSVPLLPGLSLLSQAEIALNGKSAALQRLQREDVQGVYLHEAIAGILRRAVTDPQWPAIASLCLRLWPDLIQDPDTAESFRSGFRSATNWHPDSISAHWAELRENFSGYQCKIAGRSVQLRETPSLEGSVIMKLSAGDEIYCRHRGPAASAGGRNDFWEHVVVPPGVQGWVFGGYLQKD